MRHRSTTTTPLLPVNIESRSLNERSSTLDYRNNLELLEEDWSNSQQQMGTPSSVSSSVFDICRCCGRQDCENLEYFNRTMKKLESDTRLAAEIGQGLLHKHETYVTESNQQRTQLEKQLDECHERITGLEQSLDEVENQKDVVLKEKNKWLWEYQKRQKILDETLSDLEMANEKCNQLSIDLESKSNELEKLRIFKFMVRHSETREEILTSKLEDTNQELALCRKNELVLESKIKKLKMRYESLYNSHEQLTRDVEDRMNATLTTVNNNNNNNNSDTISDTIKLVSSTNNNTNDLINLIKELSSANTKLKSDLMNCREQLSEARGEVTALIQKIDDEADNSGSDTKKKLCLQDDIKKSTSTSTRSNTMDLFKEMSNVAGSTTTRKPPPTKGKIRRAKSVKEPKYHNKKEEASAQPVPIRSKTTIQPLPTVSSSMPTITNLLSSSSPLSAGNNAIVHHHYHYYVKNSKGERIQITDETESNSSNDFSSSELMLDCCDTTAEKMDLYTTDIGQQLNSREMVLSPSTSSVLTIKDGTLTSTPSITQSPYVLLQEHVTQVLDRLRGSDIRALNRRLKRAFDITELSSMSNSVIDNILMDVDTLESRFLWIKTNPTTTEDDNNMMAFFPLLDLLKDMLKELGMLRTTMNELQVEYVKKVEESEVRVEEEIIRKRQLKRQSPPPPADSTSKPLSWLTNMFYKSSSNNHNADTTSTTTTTITNTASSATTTATDNNNNNNTTSPQHYYDRGSTLTKTTTNSSTLILSPNEDDHSTNNNHILRKDETTAAIDTTIINNSTSRSNNHHNSNNHAIRINNNTFPRQPPNNSFDKRRQIPYFPSQSTQLQQQQAPPLLQPPQMTASNSSGTSRSSPSIPIRNKRSLHRMHIDYEGIGPATIRPIPSDRDNPEWKAVNFSSSWLGGK